MELKYFMLVMMFCNYAQAAENDQAKCAQEAKMRYFGIQSPAGKSGKNIKQRAIYATRANLIDATSDESIMAKFPGLDPETIKSAKAYAKKSYLDLSKFDENSFKIAAESYDKIKLERKKKRSEKALAQECLVQTDKEPSEKKENLGPELYERDKRMKISSLVND